MPAATLTAGPTGEIRGGEHPQSRDGIVIARLAGGQGGVVGGEDVVPAGVVRRKATRVRLVQPPFRHHRTTRSIGGAGWDRTTDRRIMSPLL